MSEKDILKEVQERSQDFTAREARLARGIFYRNGLDIQEPESTVPFNGLVCAT